MIAQKRFKLKLSHQAILLATISAVYPLTGYCVAAGRVEFAIGDVESIAANGSRHLLGKGSEINAGDSISTAAGARAQLQFTDGGFISLQPGTLFRVDEYNYQNKTDGKERGFFSLLKGGFRAVTGFIGHLHKNAYRVRTAQATLGIRGTGYNMALRSDGLFVNVGEGAVSLSNKAGLLLVSAGNAAYVANFNTVPKLTIRLPLAPPKGLRVPDFKVSDQRDSSGNLTIMPGLVSGSGYAMVYASTGTTTGVGPAGALAGVTTTFSGPSQLVQYSYCSTALFTGSLGAATASFSLTDGIIGWGRWVGNTAGNAPPHPLTGVYDYVVGIPTAAMPSTATATTYSLMGYTSPTATDGSTGYTFNGSLVAVFSNNTVNVNMIVANSTSSYSLSNVPLGITGSTFTGSFIPTTCTGLSCTTSINGFFAGTNASRAGLSYSISDSSPTNNIQGVATFAKN
jgi:hypothetical protein